MKIEDILKKIKGFDADLASHVEKTIQEKEKSISTYRQQLEILERSISADYDSILVTELNLESPGPAIVYVNKGFEKLTGYKAEEVIGKTPRILQGPKTDRETLERLKRNLIEGQSFFGQTVNYRKDGSEFINQWDIHPLEDENGEITHWVSYQHDVTERKTAELNMSFDPATEYDNLDELGKSIIIDIDQQANILYANKAFREMSGFHIDELKTKKVYHLFSGGKTELDLDFFESGSETIEGINYTLKQASSKEITVKISGSWLTIDGQPIFRMLITNLSLQSRVLDAITKIKTISELEKNGNSNHPYRMILNKQGSGFIIDTISAAFEERFGSYDKGSSLSEVTIAGLTNSEQLMTWANNAIDGQSICENLSLDDEDVTLYIKAFNKNQVVLYLSPNYKVQL